MYDTNQITITISGPCNSGKTVLAYAIQHIIGEYAPGMQVIVNDHDGVVATKEQVVEALPHIGAMVIVHQIQTPRQGN